jgi:acetolactate synthase regulatory subunit
MTTTTTTLPGTTTSTTTPTTTTSTTTTTTTAPGCGDSTRPQTAIVVPTPGLVVTLVTPIVATASDTVGVTRVEFFVDGDRISTLMSAPYSILWDTTTVPNGNHVLTTRAFDACGNSQTSNGVTVSVVNLLAQGRRESELLTSELRLRDGVVQLVVGRQATHFLRDGASALVVPRAGELWLELTVVDAAGRPGEWRVALPGGERALVRVLAGDVAALAPGAVTLRLKGVRGERAALSFRAE